ncbi:Protein of unknown function [Cotesia congregata]|uniref:Uncharacterized protein n=1 Tax=Cotesia congregata TaxID=51543 RepID=A0A8J2EL14_COTCN|nr:Protein of unknown function [Cotesia congregata]
MRTFLEQGYFFRINYIQSFLFWLLFMRKGTRVEGLINYGSKFFEYTTTRTFGLLTDPPGEIDTRRFIKLKRGPLTGPITLFEIRVVKVSIEIRVVVRRVERRRTDAGGDDGGDEGGERGGHGRASGGTRGGTLTKVPRDGESAKASSTAGTGGTRAGEGSTCGSSIPATSRLVGGPWSQGSSSSSSHGN